MTTRNPRGGGNKTAAIARGRFSYSFLTGLRLCARIAEFGVWISSSKRDIHHFHNINNISRERAIHVGRFIRAGAIRVGYRCRATEGDVDNRDDILNVVDDRIADGVTVAVAGAWLARVADAIGICIFLSRVAGRRTIVAEVHDLIGIAVV